MMCPLKMSSELIFKIGSAETCVLTNSLSDPGLY